MISYKVGNRHSSPPRRRWTSSTWSDDDFGLTWLPLSRKFTGLLDANLNMFFFLSPTRRGLRGHSYKEVQGATTDGDGQPFRKGLWNHWNKLPASVGTVHSVKMFKKRLQKVRTEVYPHLPHPPTLELKAISASIIFPWALPGGCQSEQLWRPWKAWRWWQAWQLWFKKDIKLLEVIQRRSNKLVKGLQDIHYEDSLSCRMDRGDMILVYKILHYLSGGCSVTGLLPDGWQL